MKLYKISQTKNDDYDTYDAAVVAAPDEDTAKRINPRSGQVDDWSTSHYYDWVSSPDDVDAEYIGEALQGTPQGVILASFNAG